MSDQFRPMKGQPADLTKLKFPYLLTPKFDGIRCVVRGGKALSNTLKPIANAYIRECLEHPCYEGFDGELIVGEHDAGVYRRTTSAVGRRSGEPQFRYFVFDLHNHPGTAYQRAAALIGHIDDTDTAVKRVQPIEVKNHDELMLWYARTLAHGYEGVMLRSPDSPYKHGKATVNENWLLKFKPKEDFEAIVIGMTEAQENLNEKTLDERGLAKRSSHKANKVGKGIMGTLLVEALNGRYRGKVFEVGTGFTHEERVYYWAMGDDVQTIIGKVECDVAGGYDHPRFPSWKGERSLSDMTPEDGA